jgi:hypothetical protein
MLRYACEWCGVLKEPNEAWILGFAAENLGVTAARREVTVLSGWDRERAVHPFAVHFCSEAHKDNYMAALFETGPQPIVEEEVEIRRTAPKRTIVEEEVEIQRTTPAKRTIVTKAAKKRPTTARRRAS